MAFRVIPQNPLLYPGDTQEFRLQTGQTPVIWYAILDDGVADDVNSLGGTISFSDDGPCSAKIYQMLYSGMGSVRYTITNVMIPGVVIDPTPHPYFEFTLESKGDTGLLSKPFAKLQIEAGRYLVIDEGGTRQTITHTLVQGDIFEIQALANHFRVLVNGVVPHANAEWTSNNPVAYPFESNVSILPPYLGAVVGVFILTPPQLFGDWRSFEGGSGLGATREDVAWTQLGGSLDTAADVAKVVYTAGQNPGAYQITANVDTSAVQVARTEISIPPLSILGLREVTLDPGEQVKFRTNYDLAQNPIVTWNVVTVGGGSFDASNLYTAPTAPGSYILRARYLTKQEERVTVTIPPVLTPNIRAVEPGEVVDFNTNIVSPTFSASAGAMNSSSGVWVAPSVLKQIVQITATNAQTVSLFVIVLEAFPYIPNYVVSGTAQKKVITSVAEDFSEISRLKSRRGRYRRVFDFEFRNRDLTELNAVLEFWNTYHPGGSFIYKDLDNDENIAGYFDTQSDLRYSVGAGGTCDVTYSFRFVERIDF